jgi:long-chain fatty acid transport protein
VALGKIAPALQPLFGGPVFRTDASTVVNFPEIFTWGLAFRPTSKLTVGVDVDWGRWSSFDETLFSVKNKVPAARFGDIPVNFKWEDAVAVKVGAEYRLTDRVALRGGYAFVETMVPGSTLNPSNPDSDQHNLCVGFGYKIHGYDLDVFYIAGFFHDRKSTNAILAGEYKNFVHYGGFSVGYKF